MPLHLARLTPNPARLVAFAASARALPSGGDLGYAIHLALRRALGATAPQPFRFVEPSGYLYGYVLDREALQAAAAAPATSPEIEAARVALALDSLKLKPMPSSWRAGSRYGFEVRLRPVRRVGKDKRSVDRPGEHDAFGVAVRGLPREAWPAPREVYLEWARERLTASGARMLADAHLSAMTRTEVARRRHDGSGVRSRIDGPDVTVAGTLEVMEPDAFASILARGVGRHRAFGFGMLLLRPPTRG